MPTFLFGADVVTCGTVSTGDGGGARGMVTTGVFLVQGPLISSRL